MIFRRKQDPKLKLTQKEREAIVDLFHLCLYADSHIALKEGDFISQLVDVIGWETKRSFSTYEARSVSSARAARENPASKAKFIEGASVRLESKEARA